MRGKDTMAVQDKGKSKTKGGAKGKKDASQRPSHWGLANLLRERYPSVFKTKIAAKQIVDIVLELGGEILETDGYLCLRGIGTIRASKAIERKEDKVHPPKNSVRRRLSISTSWAMLDRLNPDNPKRKKRG